MQDPDGEAETGQRFPDSFPASAADSHVGVDHAGLPGVRVIVGFGREISDAGMNRNRTSADAAESAGVSADGGA
jgi:hypothetical protein